MWALFAVAALLVLVCQCQLALCGGSDVYTLLHRVQSADYEAPSAAWSPRALVRVPVGQTAEVTPYEPISGADLPVADKDTSKTWYQLMLVDGDVRAKSAKEWQSLESTHQYPVAFTKTCMLYTGADGVLHDAVQLHLSGDPMAPGIDIPRVSAMSYAVDTGYPLGLDACPQPSDGPNKVATRFDTDLRVLVPDVPEQPLRKIQIPLKEDGTPQAPPAEPKSFLQKYWMYLLPLVVLMLIPAPEDPQESAQGGAAARPGRVVAGPQAARQAAAPRR